MLRYASLLFTSFLFVSMIGCGNSSGKYVPVSGVVKINGKPAANIVVIFQPVGSKDNPNPGRGSYAITDDNGKFVMKHDNGDGAVVGLHQIKLRSNTESMAIDPNTGSSDKAPTPGAGKIDPIPADWRSLSDKHTFEVPAGGTTEANFEVTSTIKK